MSAIIFPPFNEETSRYERKFVVNDMYFTEVEQQIRIHPISFSPLFYPRYINNIYFDTNEMDFFYDNVSGKGSRKKARIRWYADQFGRIEKPVLEFKVREGMLGNKLSFRLKPFTVNDNFNYEKLLESIDASELPAWAREIMHQLKPALMNRYRRHYFISFDEKYRITLDDELSYFAIGMDNNFFLEKYSGEETIVELKYERKYDNDATYVTTRLPFRLTKSSKYVNGMELLHPNLG
jgi:SPX domain protein involved in polyphosphate accumulation